jgi:hypothetical protein
MKLVWVIVMFAAFSCADADDGDKNTGLGTDSGSDTGLGTDSGSGTGLGMDGGSDIGLGTDSESDTGLGTDSGTDSGNDTGLGTDSGSDTEHGEDSGSDAGFGTDTMDTESGDSDSGLSTDSDDGLMDTDPGAPLLERPLTIAFDCRVSREMTPFEIPWYDFDMVEAPEGAYLSRAELEWTSPKSEDRLVGSFLSADGILGSPAIIQSETEPNAMAFRTAIANAPGGYAIVWLHREFTSTGEKTLFFSRIYMDGNVVGTPSNLVSTTAVLEDPVLIENEEGHAVVWVGGTDTEKRLMYGVIGNDGTFNESPKSIAEGARLYTGHAVRFGDGIAVSFDLQEALGSGYERQILVLDSEGTPRGETILLAEDLNVVSSWGTNAAAITVRDGMLLAAWSVESQDNGGGNGVTINVARFTEEGLLASPVYQLATAVDEQERVDPVWVDMGEDVGLMWAEGSIIYICAGCMPDHQLKYVILDGDDLTPKSEIITLANDATEGGLLDAEAVRDGDDITIISSIHYHLWSEGASGTVTCSHF